MSAIAVIFNLNNKPVECRQMQRVLDRLEHRGIDDEGIHIESNLGLGHRMRWATPESRNEKLPWKSAETGAVITCDARLDNRAELIQQLSLAHRKPEEITDSEIILLSYEKWGDVFVEKLLGDFVFAIWDPREQRLLCGRDSMGAKHFYYYYKPNELFALASEIKALFHLDGLPKELNETHIGDVLMLNYNDKLSTPYIGIKRLPANNALAIDRNGIKVWQYWRPVLRRSPRLRKARDFEDEFREIFKTAVTCRLRSVSNVGSMLSGGLDSSSISCIAAQYLSEKGRPPLETFSAIFPTIAEIDPRIDERGFIKSVTTSINCKPNFVEADAYSPWKDLTKMHWHADHPIGVPNVFMDWALFKAAGERNVNVLLSGFDGDSTVSYGYEAFYFLARKGQWLRMVKDAMMLNKNMPHRHHSLKRLLWHRGFEPAIPETVRQVKRVLNGRPRKLPKTRALPSTHQNSLNAIDRAFAEKYDLTGRYFDQVEQNQPIGVDYANEWWNGLCNGLFAFALETFEKTGAAFGVEPRFPFFDRRLIEFCMSLPPEQMLYKGWTRSIFRRAMAGILPPDVQWRTDKANIGLSFKVNMLKHGRSSVEEAIFGYPGTLARFINVDSLTAAYRRYEADPLKYEAEPMLVMSTVCLSNWLRNSFGETSN